MSLIGFQPRMQFIMAIITQANMQDQPHYLQQDLLWAVAADENTLTSVGRA